MRLRRTFVSLALRAGVERPAVDASRILGPLSFVALAAASFGTGCADAAEIVLSPDGGEGAADASIDDASDEADAADAGVMCEADLSSDVENCGACGHGCVPSQVCTAGVCTCTDVAPVSFANDVQPIFTKSCAYGMCHPNGAGAVGLQLGIGKAYGSLVGVESAGCGDEGRARVVPGQPADSYLVDKLLGVRLCSGSRMPGDQGLPAEKIQTMIDWICAGAADD